MGLLAKMTALSLTLMCYVGQVMPANQSQIKVELRLAESDPGKDLIEASVEKSKEKIHLHKEAIITNEDIAEVRVVRSVGSRRLREDGSLAETYDIEIDFTKEGGMRISKITGENIGKRLAVLFNGKVVMAPTIRGQISDRGVITGNFTKEEAESIAKGIKGGKMH